MAGGFARTALVIIVLAGVMAGLLCGSALAVTVEQVQVCMPEIDVYFYGEGEDLSALSPADISAQLGQRALAVEAFSPSEQGIFYVYLLDVSASIPAGHFAAAKAAVLEAQGRLRDQDRLALLAFGNKVNLLLEGGETKAKVTETVNGLRNDDGSTHFYDAMAVLVDLVAQTEDMRRVAVVISDGIDDTDAGMTQAELEEELLRTGVSVSALCMDDASPSDVERFGDFIRLSGGELFTFGPDNAGQVLGDLLDRLAGGWYLSLRAENNLASGQEEVLSVRWGADQSLELLVTPERWTPDQQPPRVIAVDYSPEENAFTLTFSEPVAGAADPAAYALTDEAGRPVEIAAVTASDSRTSRLALAAPPPEDAGLALSVRGIRDISMEENELTPYDQAVWSNAPLPEESPGAPKEPFIETGTLIIIGLATVLVAAALAAVLRLSRRKVGAKPKQERKPRKDKTEATESTATFMFLDAEDRKGKR